MPVLCLRVPPIAQQVDALAELSKLLRHKQASGKLLSEKQQQILEQCQSWKSALETGRQVQHDCCCID